MKKSDFMKFQAALNISIELDSSLRRISEKIKLLHQFKDVDALHEVAKLLTSCDQSVDNVVSNICSDDEQ